MFRFVSSSVDGPGAGCRSLPLRLNSGPCSVTGGNFSSSVGFSGGVVSSFEVSGRGN